MGLGLVTPAQLGFDLRKVAFIATLTVGLYTLLRVAKLLGPPGLTRHSGSACADCANSRHEGCSRPNDPIERLASA
jgi:hypothetical protein